MTHHRSIAVFGTGQSARSYAAQHRKDIVLFLDNNPDRQGSHFLGRPVIAPQDLPNFNVSHIVCPGMYAPEMVAQLESLGIAREKMTVPDIDQINTTRIEMPWGCLSIIVMTLTFILVIAYQWLN